MGYYYGPLRLVWRKAEGSDLSIKACVERG